jgi:Mg2+-importing ATPase
VAASESAGLTTHGFTKIDEIPHDFLRRRLTIVVAEGGTPMQHLIVTKGAFSNVLDICSSFERDAVDIPLATELRAELDAVFKAKGAEGFRVLAVATRRVAAKERYARDDEQGMTFRGFLVFFDPPKEDAQRTIHDLVQLGIRIKVISGDNRYVTAHLAQAVGLNPKSILTGDDLGTMRDEALWHPRHAPTYSSKSILSRRSGSFAPCSEPDIVWGTLATALTMRRPCARPMSASRLSKPWMLHASPPTSSC